MSLRTPYVRNSYVVFHGKDFFFFDFTSAVAFCVAAGINTETKITRHTLRVDQGKISESSVPWDAKKEQEEIRSWG